MERHLAIIMAALILTSAYAAAAEKEQKGPIYIPGMGLLEIFKTDSPDEIAHMETVLRVPWMHELACKPPESGSNIWLVREGYPDAFLVPECAPGLGAKPGSEYSFPYVAQITFYYKTKEAGAYTFSVWHGRNTLTLTVGDFLVTNLSSDEPEARGICELKEGFNYVVLWLISNIAGGDSKNDPYFEIRVSPPGAKEAAVISRDMMFLKPTNIPRPWRGMLRR
jgi:hypothetical protein